MVPKKAFVTESIFNKVLLSTFCNHTYTVNSLIKGHANQRTPLINGQIHVPRRIANQTLIVDSLKCGQSISGPSFQRTHFHFQNEDFDLFFSLFSGQGKKNYKHFFFNSYFILNNDFSHFVPVFCLLEFQILPTRSLFHAH